MSKPWMMLIALRKTMDNRQQYIKNQSEKAKIKNGFNVGSVNILFGEDPHFNVDSFVQNKLNKIPEDLLNCVNKIIFGGFYLDGSYVGKSVNDIIFLSNKTDEDSLFSDLIHELAHAYIRKNYEKVFGDGRLQKEFLSKRSKLYHKMRSTGVPLLPHPFYENPRFDDKFDKYLDKSIGYDTLSQLISGIFPTCYSVTSLEEYFCVGLDSVFSGREKILEDCPVLMEKVSI